MSSAPSQSQSISWPCKICSLPTKTFNLGVLSCRACANFFKRTHLKGTLYACRENRGGCPVRRDLPFLCRRCRFDKCVSVGMELPKKFMQISTIPPSNQQCSLPVTLGKGSRDSLLLEMGEQFNLGYAKRAQLESALWRTKHHRDSHNEIRSPIGTSYFHGTNSFMNDASVSFMQDSIELCSIVFPEFRNISQANQQEIFLATSNTAYMMECFYLAEKIFPNDDRYVFFSTTSIYDTECPEAFFCNVEKNKIEGIKLMKNYTEKYNKLTRATLRNARFTEIEFHAALILLTWSFNLAPWVPEEIVEIGDRIKMKVFKELSKYYRNDLKCDVAFRLGQLMLCVHTMQEAWSMMQEEFQTYRLLGVLKDEEPVVQFVLAQTE